MAGQKKQFRFGPSNHSLAARTYDAVRAEIDTGNLAPGEQISVARIAKWLDISSTPVREGLHRLRVEGLLALDERHSFQVVTIDNDALKELYVARQWLEAEAAGLAALNGSNGEFDELKRLLEIEPELVDDTLALYQHNTRFHDHIYRAAHNRYLADALKSLNTALLIERRMASYQDTVRRGEVLREHRLLVHAILRRDSVAASKVAATHIKSALKAQIKARTAALDPTDSEH